GGDVESAYRTYFTDIFLSHPWYDAALPSLVYEHDDGRVLGFLGVVPRRMWLGDRPVRAAVGSQFIVEPSRRSTLAAVKLLKAFLSGPQDLPIADEANDVSRKLWERLGGAAALLYSMYWLRPLRPSRFVMHRLGRRGVSTAVARASTPFC